MAAKQLNILRLDARREDVRQGMQALRKKLSPEGDVVSEAGRKRTLDVFGEALTPQQVVERICADVRDQGLASVLDYSRRIDQGDISKETVRVHSDRIIEAHRQADPSFVASVRRIRDNILEFQRAILHKGITLEREGGVSLRQRYVPLERIGVCVPGGAAAYPSTVLMTAAPAIAAGVKQIAIIAPPTAFGADNPDVLAVCHELGVSEVYRVGGAQGVAALAYGAEGMPKVDKIVGPGNLFVALAKRHVYGEVDIDSIAGPSEVIVIADETTRPDFTAADLLAQAEHAPGASILVTWSEEVLERTYGELQRQVSELSRGEWAIQSLEDYGALILVRDANEACQISDYMAPEHLHIASDKAELLLPNIRHAGAVFLGNYTPVALGDYVAGPSHVLPTSGTARWAAGLTANDFLRSMSVISYSEHGLQKVAGDVQMLADKEGLTAHRASVDIRL